MSKIVKNCDYCHERFITKHKRVNFCSKECGYRYRGERVCDRFNEHVTPTNKRTCWEWEGNLFPTGYGVFSIRRKTIGAHRASWRLYNGDIPDDLQVLHKCDNRKCVNPYHLYLGTIEDNMRDKVERGRSLKGEDVPTSVLTKKQVKEIRKLYRQGVVQTELAKRYGVHQGTISGIVLKKTWKHI